MTSRRTSRPKKRRSPGVRKNSGELPEGVEIGGGSSFIADSAKVDPKIKAKSLIAQDDSEVANVRAEGIELWVGVGSKLIRVNSPENGRLEVGERSLLWNVSLEHGYGEHDVFIVVGDRTRIEHARLRGAVSVGSGCKIEGKSDNFISITGSEIGDNVALYGGRFESGCKVGSGSTLSDAVMRSGSLVGPGSRADYIDMSDGAIFHGDAERMTVYMHAKVGDPSTDERVSVGRLVAVLAHSVVRGGTRLDDEVSVGAHCKIGKNVTIGHGALIRDYVVVEDHVTIGEGAEIEAGNVISADVAPGATIKKPALKVAEGAPAFTVQADAESWKLMRLAEIAGHSPGQRLDKRVLMMVHPQLVETATVKSLLKHPKPLTAAELREKARIFERHPKFNVYFVPEGWKGIQVIGRGANDVLLYDVDESVIDGLASSYPLTDLPVLSAAGPNAGGPSFVHALLSLGKSDAHPGGDRPLCVGWARIKPYIGHKSILVEELQSDLVALAFDPARELHVLASDYRDYLLRMGVAHPLDCTIAEPSGGGPRRRIYDGVAVARAGVALDFTVEQLSTAFASLGRVVEHTERFEPSGWSYENVLAMAGFYRCAVPEILWQDMIALGESGEYGYSPPVADALLYHGVVASLLYNMRGTTSVRLDRDDDWENVVFGRGKKDPTLVELVRAIAQRNRDAEQREYGGHGGALSYDEMEAMKAVASETWKAVSGKQFDHPVFQLMRRDAEEIVANARKLIEWGVHTVRLFREIFSDLYESMLAGILTFAREQEMKDVWLFDYGTKYALAAYEGLEPPRSVYTDLPKRFQVAPVQRLPEYMDVSKYEEERQERVNLPRAKEMPREPMGRRLLPNRSQR